MFMLRNANASFFKKKNKKNQRTVVVAPDSSESVPVRCDNMTAQFLDPLPPMSQIHSLDDDILLEIFSCYRLEDEDNWYLRLSWRKLVHVCRRWRHLIYEESSYMDMCLLLTNHSPSMGPPSHLLHLPLVIACSDRTKTTIRNGEDNIHLGLQQHDRVRRVFLRAPSSSLRMWLEPMNKHFPRLRDLSLFSTTTEETSLVLPELLQAPDLHHLSLHGVGLPNRSPLSSMISLSILSLTHIQGCCYFPPGHLVTQLRGLPYLEELSIGFAVPIPLPNSEGNLFSSPTPPVIMLHTLRRLTFRGEDDYLDDLVAQINTPLLKRLDLTLFFDVAFTLVNLTEFIRRTEGFGCSVARVIFHKDGASIDTGTSYHEQDIGKLSLHVNCESIDWKIHSATEVCSALEKVLSSVEELTLDLDVDESDEMPSDWKNTLYDELWHDLLLQFIGVKKLHIGPSLTLEISQGLESLNGALVLDLLPKLKELEVPLAFEFGLATNAFSVFMKTRESVGRPVQRIPPFPPPELRCRSCRRLSPRHEVERWGGFCSERHKWEWLVVIILPLFKDRQLSLC